MLMTPDTSHASPNRTTGPGSSEDPDSWTTLPENLVSLEAALDGLGQDFGPGAFRHGRRCAYLLEDDFAAILLDVKMPDMDGFQTAELIRSRKRSRPYPRSCSLPATRATNTCSRYDLGAVDFLFKPIVPEFSDPRSEFFVQLSRNTALLRRQTEVLGKAEQKFRVGARSGARCHDHQRRGWPDQPG